MRVLAVTPTYGDEMRPQMRASMEAQQREGLELEWAIVDDNPWPAPDHRNVLHQYRQARLRALAEGFDVMWTVEHDMVLPPHAALSLAATPGDVAYGVYLVRVGVPVLNAFEYVNDVNIGESLSMYPARAEAARRRVVVRVSGAGWGCTWIRRRALEAVEFPEVYPENWPFDLAFAQKALRAKLRLYANFDVLCGHYRGEELLMPFATAGAVDYSGAGWLIGGQFMPMYQAPEIPPPAAVAPPAPEPESVEVRALQTLSALVYGESQRLLAGEEYTLPGDVAAELARAGYVEVLHGQA